jgi:hypothetical protein
MDAYAPITRSRAMPLCSMVRHDLLGSWHRSTFARRRLWSISDALATCIEIPTKSGACLCLAYTQIPILTAPLHDCQGLLR